MQRPIVRVRMATILLSAMLLCGAGGFVSSSVAQQVTVSTSGQYSRGDYVFTESTDVFAWTTDLSLTQGRLQAGVSVPLLVQTTPWVSYTGGGFTPSGGPQHAAVGSGRRGPQRGRRAPVALPDTESIRQTGVGDPLLRASVAVVRPDTTEWGVRLTATLKPPLADADAGFSTGAWDGGIGVVVSRMLSPWFVLVEGTYWWLGDLDDLPLKNGATYSVAVGQTFFEGRWGLLASLSGSTTVIEGIDPPLSLNGGLGFSTGEWGVNATVSSGLSEGAADWSFGLGATLTLNN